MSGLEFSCLAEEDIVAIGKYVARDNPVAAHALVDRIEARCQQLVDIPNLGEYRPDVAQGQYRSTVVGNYVIYYTADAGKIWIARVLHGARDHGPLL